MALGVFISLPVYGFGLTIKDMREKEPTRRLLESDMASGSLNIRCELGLTVIPFPLPL